MQDIFYFSSCYSVLSDPEALKPTILVANHWDIRQINIDGSNLSPPYVHVGERVTSLDFNHREKKVCWVCISFHFSLNSRAQLFKASLA